MKSFAAIVLAFAIPALAQTVLDLPQCAQSPILEAIQTSGCPLTDLTCICGNKAFVDNVATKIPTVCTLEQTYFVSAFAIRLCGAADVVLDLPASIIGPSDTSSTSADASSTSAAASASTTPAASPSVTTASSSLSTSAAAPSTTASASATAAASSTPAPTTSQAPNAGAAHTAGLIGLMGAVAVGVLGGL